MKGRLTVALVCVVLLVAAPVVATTIYVDDDAPNDPGPGDPAASDPLEDGTVAHPYDAIQEGLDAAVSGLDTVIVKNGTYTGVGNRDLDFQCKAIAVQGEAGADKTIIDCQGAGRGFNFHLGEGPAAIVQGFTIRNGATATQDGGAIACEDSSPTISDCMITNNQATSGGGIYCHLGAPTITGCTINGNSTGSGGGGGGRGGGIYIWNSTPTITSCTITGNLAGYWGGGIDCAYANPEITDCAIVGNWADNAGGGIAVSIGSNPTIRDCVVRGNRSNYIPDGGGGSGGGVYLDQSSAQIHNCLIISNSADTNGGGLDCFYSNPDLLNCTIAHNWAGGDGGGLYCYEAGPTLVNCILWDDGPQEIYVHSGSATVSYSCVQDDDPDDGIVYPGSANIDDDPLFQVGPLHAYYLSQIAPGQATDSPCVDTGSDTAVNLGLDALTTRTDGVPDAGTVDMGYHAPPAIFGDVDGNGIVDGLDLSAVLSAWETVPGDLLWNANADLDCNGLVDGLDLTEVISNWTTPGAAPAAAAPPAAPRAERGRSGAAPGNVNRGKGSVRRR